MEDVIKKKKPPKSLIILTIVSLICYVLGGLYEIIPSLSGLEDAWIVKGLVISLIPDICDTIPVVLMLIYLWKFYNPDDTKKMLPYVFLGIVIANVILCICLGVSLESFIGNALFCSPIIAAFIVATVGAFKGKLNKVFIIIGTSIILLKQLILTYNLLKNNFNFFTYIRYFDADSRLYYICSFVSNICLYSGCILFCIVMILLCVKKKKVAQQPQDVPEDTSYAPYQEEYQGYQESEDYQEYQGYQEYHNYQEYQSYEYSAPQVAQEFAPEPQVAQEPTSEPLKTPELTSEQMLIFLREQYKSGIISEEEYLAKMAEVVKTL